MWFFLRQSSKVFELQHRDLSYKINKYEMIFRLNIQKSSAKINKGLDPSNSLILKCEIDYTPKYEAYY